MQLHPFVSLTSTSVLLVQYGDMATGLGRLGFTKRTILLSLGTSQNRFCWSSSVFWNTASPANTSHTGSRWRKPVPVSPELEQGGTPAGMVPLRQEHTVSEPAPSLNIIFEVVVPVCYIFSLPVSLPFGPCLCHCPRTLHNRTLWISTDLAVLCLTVEFSSLFWVT